VITFEITEVETGETTELKADSRDVLVWEKTSRSNETYIDLITGMSLVKFYRLAHIAAKRQEVFSGKLAEFEQAYLLTLPVEEETTPTQGDPTSEE
jgi:hypothetical protein